MKKSSSHEFDKIVNSEILPLIYTALHTLKLNTANTSKSILVENFYNEKVQELKEVVTKYIDIQSKACKDFDFNDQAIEEFIQFENNLLTQS